MTAVARSVRPAPGAPCRVVVPGTDPRGAMRRCRMRSRAGM
jgi:hypothetical protein